MVFVDMVFVDMVFGVTMCSGWSAALEALTAFVGYYVVPSLTLENEGILLHPILGYLSGYS